METQEFLLFYYVFQLSYHTAVVIESKLEKNGFGCWNCGLEFEYDMGTRNVYVKQ